MFHPILPFLAHSYYYLLVILLANSFSQALYAQSKQEETPEEILSSQVGNKSEVIHLTRQEIQYILNSAIGYSMQRAMMSLSFNTELPSKYLLNTSKSNVKFGWRLDPNDNLLSTFRSKSKFEYDQVIMVDSFLSDFSPIQQVIFERQTKDESGSFINGDLQAIYTISNIYFQGNEINFFLGIISKDPESHQVIKEELLIVKAIYCPNKEIILKSLTSAHGWFFPDRKQTVYPNIQIPNMGCPQ